MYGKVDLDRFKTAHALEPFSVTANSTTKAAQSAFRGPTHLTTVSANQAQGSHPQNQYLNHQNVVNKTVSTDVAPTMVPTQQVTQVGGGQLTCQPPDWAIEPCPCVYYLDVLKDGEVLDWINLDERRHISSGQFHACDFVIDHQSVSRQHAAIILRKNGSIYVVDLGSVHGTFVANERLTKD